MFIRFVVGTLDQRSGRRQGIFEAGAELRRSGRMSGSDVERLNTLREWFVLHLPIPTRFAVSSKPNRKPQALSWFRDDATVHVDRMREYQQVLEAYDVTVEMLRTGRPGYILYEDAYQVVAYPFADTPC